ncbi:MAG: peptidylprolyl isomerase [Edaphocola sp.]
MKFFLSPITYLLPLLAAAQILMLSSCGSHKKYDNPAVVVATKFGDIVMELYPEKAPASVAAFLKNVDAGYYTNASFYRIMSDDNQVTGVPHSNLIQGGIWQSNPALEKTLPKIPHETTKTTGLAHTKGTVSLARLEPGSAESEFFICINDEPGFDYGGTNNPDGQGYAAFGKVTEGMETVQKIYRQPEHEQSFTPPVTIINIKRL